MHPNTQHELRCACRASIKSSEAESELGICFYCQSGGIGRRPRLMFLVDALRRTAAEQLTGSNPVLAANQKNCCIFVLWKRNYLRTQTESSCICSIGLVVVSMTYGHQTKKRHTVVWWMREKIGKRRTRLTVNYVPTTSRCVVVLTHSTKNKTVWVGACVCNNNGGIA